MLDSEPRPGRPISVLSMVNGILMLEAGTAPSNPRLLAPFSYLFFLSVLALFVSSSPPYTRPNELYDTNGRLQPRRHQGLGL